MRIILYFSRELKDLLCNDYLSLKKILGFNLFFEKFECQIKHTLEYKWIIACQIVSEK